MPEPNSHFTTDKTQQAARRGGDIPSFSAVTPAPLKDCSLKALTGHHSQEASPQGREPGPRLAGLAVRAASLSRDPDIPARPGLTGFCPFPQEQREQCAPCTEVSRCIKPSHRQAQKDTRPDLTRMCQQTRHTPQQERSTVVTRGLDRVGSAKAPHPGASSSNGLVCILQSTREEATAPLQRNDQCLGGGEEHSLS